MLFNQNLKLPSGHFGLIMPLKQQEKKEFTILVEALVLITLKIRTMAQK